MAIKSNNFCVVLSSPSGAGKTSISKKLLKIDKLISLSISCTTRPKRKGEIHKKDYIFLSEKKFSEAVSKNEFLEHANVFGFRYGTLKQTVDKYYKKKLDVLFDIDCSTNKQTMEVVGIFILPPSKRELIKRLKTRARDTKSEMKKRMSMVQNEISHFPEYDYVVINKNLKSCVNQIKNIIEAERSRRSRLNNLTNFVNKFRD